MKYTASQPTVEPPPTDLPALVTYIEDHYHAPLRFDLGMLTALLDVCAAIAPSVPSLVRVCVAFEGLRHDILEHLRAEERGVFRLIRGESPTSPTTTALAVHGHHDYLGEQLVRVAELVGEHEAPVAYAAPWKRFVEKLREVVDDFAVHTALETETIIPQAVEQRLIREGFDKPTKRGVS